MNTCFEVANYFLKRQDKEAGDLMSNLKLQKLVYYAQGFHLAFEGKALFLEEISAWEHGPVCFDLWKKYRKHKSAGIPIPYDVDALSCFTKKTREILDEVYRCYGQFSAWKLRNLTHEDSPWLAAYKNGGSVISQESMETYFKTLIILA
ncbi:MAG: DUF4065 domain-containing protein [Candidatus Cloacimonetes bacterium]|nr:DUF4065 domain-containing protein [Candidatus Cloacimonadota bacterium]